MNGHMFELKVDQKLKGQYQDTIDQLQVYTLYTSKKEMKHLKIIFTQLKQPVVPKTEMIKDSSAINETLF